MSELDLKKISEQSNPESFFEEIEREAREKEAERAKALKKSYIEYDAKHYLNLQLAKDENNKDVTIRILPFDPENNNWAPFQEGFSHLVKVDDKYKYYTCLEQTKGIDHLGLGNKCPFCELKRKTFERLKVEQNENKKKELKEILKKTNTYNQWYVRVIDRNNEEDGPKIWRFNRPYSRPGNYDMMYNIYKERRDEALEYDNIENYNIFDISDGRDFTIKVVSNIRPNGSKSSMVQSITDKGRNTPLSKDTKKIEEWLYDSKKWYHLFPPKPYGYLEVLMYGGTPMLVAGTNIWSNKNEFDLIKSRGKIAKYSEEEGKWVEVDEETIMSEDEYSGQALFGDYADLNESDNDGNDDNDITDGLPF